MTIFSLINKGELSLNEKIKIIPAEDYSLVLTAQELIETAKEDVEKFKQDNEKLCNTLQEEAKQKGFSEGLDTFNDQLIALDQQVKTVRLDVQNQILSLAMQAIKKIIGTELELKPERVVDIVAQALKPVSQNYEIKLLVSKHDKDIIEEQKERLKKLLDHVKVLVIEEREDIEKGGCIIETETGIINATLENQLRALESALERFYKK